MGWKKSNLGMKKITRKKREKEILAGGEEFPVDVALQPQPPYDVIEEGDWGDWIHPPLKPRKHQHLHSLNRLRLEHVLGTLNLQKTSLNLRSPEFQESIERVK